MTRAFHPRTRFRQADNRLWIGGRPAVDWADALGTPAFVYDRQMVARRVDRLRAALPERVALHYAVKANPFGPLLAHLAGLVDGFDVASAGELERVLPHRRPGQPVSFAGPGKRDAEIAAGIRAGIAFNAESEGEILRIHRIGAGLGRRPRVALRLNPDFVLKASGMQMGGGPQPFGIDAERAGAALGLVERLELEFAGIHVFAGSQNLDAGAIAEALDATFELGRRLVEENGRSLPEFNLGGGLGIPYFPGQAPLEPEAVGNPLRYLIERHADWLADTRIVMELGRFLVGEAGVYLTRVVDRKVSRGHTILVTDGGMHHHLALSGNLGQVLRKNYFLALADRLEGPVETVDIHGPLCTPLDIVGKGVELPWAGPGDVLAVFQSGAYGATASPQQFLSHPAPVERLV